jgi:hypothetical protein
VSPAGLSVLHQNVICCTEGIALVGGLVAGSGNDLLSTALIEAAAALVAEPEMDTTSDAVCTCGHHLRCLLPLPSRSAGLETVLH